MRSRDEDNFSKSDQSPDAALELQKAVSSPQQKPVNLLPEVPMQTSRKLSDREERDCDVIGKILVHLDAVEMTAQFNLPANRVFLTRFDLSSFQRDSSSLTFTL